MPVSLFAQLPVFAVVRFREPCDLDRVLDTLRSSGVQLLEVTADTPGALAAVARAADAGRAVGAGTIRSSQQARAFAKAGAAFLVSPGLDAEVVRTAASVGTAVIPGALTPTEISAAALAGVAAVKLFPASLGGPEYLRVLREGPFGDVRFVPTGGIAIEEVSAWLEAGAVAVGLGTSLVGTSPPRSGADLRRLERRARRAVELASGPGR